MVSRPEAALRGTALSVLAGVLDEALQHPTLSLTVSTHIQPGSWSILHVAVSLTQEKPLGPFLASETLLQVSPIGKEPCDASYLHRTGVCQARAGRYEWVSTGPRGKVDTWPSALSRTLSFIPGHTCPHGKPIRQPDFSAQHSKLISARSSTFAE